MKIRLFTLLLFLTSFCVGFAQTVIKVPFQQSTPFVVQPQVIYLSLDNNPSLTLGLDLEIYGGSGTYNFTWTVNNSQVSTEPTLAITEAGTYNLMVNDGKGCQSGTTYIVNGGTSIDNSRTENKINIYPNPSNGIFFLDIPEGEILNKVEIYSMDGRLQKSFAISLNNTKEVEINAESLSSGQYLIVSYLELKKITKVLIVK